MATPVDPNSQAALNTGTIAELKQLVAKARDFVARVYIPDLLAIASFYKDWAGHGRGIGNYLAYGEYPEGDARRGYERYPVKFVIDELRCIFCGYCVEACPCDAIRMDTGIHAVPYDSRDQFIYEKDLLLSIPGRDGSFETKNPRHEPGDPTHPGLDREHAAH